MDISELEKQRGRLIQEISEFPIFRPGTLTSRYRRCGKSNCHCADKNSKGHGPSWTITRKVKGKTVANIFARGFWKTHRNKSRITIGFKMLLISL